MTWRAMCARPHLRVHLAPALRPFLVLFCVLPLARLGRGLGRGLGLGLGITFPARIRCGRGFLRARLEAPPVSTRSVGAGDDVVPHGRGVHSSPFQFSLRHFLVTQTVRPPCVSHNRVLTLSRQVENCRSLPRGGAHVRATHHPVAELGADGIGAAAWRHQRPIVL